MGEHTRQAVDPTEVIKKACVPENIKETALREVWMAEMQGRDVEAWLKYWLEQHELNEEPALVYVEPDILDQRAWEKRPDPCELADQQYHGERKDDV